MDSPDPTQILRAFVMHIDNALFAERVADQTIAAMMDEGMTSDEMAAASPQAVAALAARVALTQFLGGLDVAMRLGVVA